MNNNYRTVTHREEIYSKIKDGVSKVSRIVARTLGPGGLPILIERTGEQLTGEPLGPLITKDGVTVANECFSEDPVTDVVIQAIKAICSKTNRIAGDGTTSAIVLGNAILQEAFDTIDKEGVNPQELRTMLEAAAEEVYEHLSDAAIECNDLDLIQHVATISANGDEAIGKVIRDAFEAVGSEGVITVDEGSGREHSLDVINGFQFKRGAEGQDRFYNNSTRTKFEAEKTAVVIYDGKLHHGADVLHALKVIHSNAEENNESMPPVLFIANEFGLEALQVMLMNKAEGVLSICAVKGPNVTHVRTEQYDDLATFLGGYRLGNGNRNLKNMTADDVGLVERVVVDKYTTTFFGGYGNEELVLERVEQLKERRKIAESPYDAALISDRIAGLSEGVAKIGVGGSTEMEIKEKYHRIEDAVNAARAAVEEGIAPGGGTTLYRISDVLGEDTLGKKILKRALKAPLNQILDNLGITEKASIFKAIAKSESLVYDGKNHNLVHGIKAGIVDPVKVTRTALENAISISALLCTCGGAITFVRK